MNDELQAIIRLWEAIEAQEKQVVLPVWNHKPRIGKKQLWRVNHRTLDRHVDWYDWDQIRWATASYIRRIIEGDTFYEWDMHDIQILPIRMERFINAARDGFLRADLYDYQSLLSRIDLFMHSQAGVCVNRGDDQGICKVKGANLR